MATLPIFKAAVRSCQVVASLQLVDFIRIMRKNLFILT
jgi:hypothetical protein